LDIGHRIREIRENLGMQAAVLARRVEVAPNTIYRIEAGDRTPSVALLEKIARELRTEPAELLRETLPLPEASQETGHLEADPPKDRAAWERLLASIHERQSNVEVKVAGLVELPRGEVNPYQVKWALDEARDCKNALMLSPPGSRRRRIQGRDEVVIDARTVDLDQFEEWQQEWLKAKRFYDDIVETLVDAGLVELQERTGQKAEPVPVGI
jgi:transcriptional regulator with XRE-family HTH domain